MALAAGDEGGAGGWVVRFRGWSVTESQIYRAIGMDITSACTFLRTEHGQTEPERGRQVSAARDGGTQELT